MEKSKVYFTDFRTVLGVSLTEKLQKLIKKAGIESMDIDGKDVEDDETYSIAVQSYFYCSAEEFFGISAEEAEENGKPAELASSMQNVIIEYFDDHDYIKFDGEQRLVIHGRQL